MSRLRRLRLFRERLESTDARLERVPLELHRSERLQSKAHRANQQNDLAQIHNERAEPLLVLLPELFTLRDQVIQLLRHVPKVRQHLRGDRDTDRGDVRTKQLELHARSAGRLLEHLIEMLAVLERLLVPSGEMLRLCPLTLARERECELQRGVTTRHLRKRAGAVARTRHVRVQQLAIPRAHLGLVDLSRCLHAALVLVRELARLRRHLSEQRLRLSLRHLDLRVDPVGDHRERLRDTALGDRIRNVPSCHAVRRHCVRLVRVRVDHRQDRVVRVHRGSLRREALARHHARHRERFSRGDPELARSRHDVRQRGHERLQ